MAAYPIIPDRITNVKPKHKTGVIEFANGVEQRYKCWTRQKKTFRLEHSMLSLAQQKTLDDFFKAQDGQFGEFTLYNHHDGQTYKVRFAVDELDFQKINMWLANLTVEVCTC